MNIHDLDDLYTRDRKKVGPEAAKVFYPIKCTRPPPPRKPHMPSRALYLLISIPLYIRDYIREFYTSYKLYTIVSLLSRLIYSS